MHVVDNAASMGGQRKYTPVLMVLVNNQGRVILKICMGGTGWAVKELSWNNKSADVQNLLTKAMIEKVLPLHLQTMSAEEEWAYSHEWNKKQYATSSAFLLAVYSDYLSAAQLVLKCPDGTVQPKGAQKNRF
ncbi:endoglucanase 5 [Tanacetum coccineum]